MPQPLPRAYRRQLQAEDQEKLERILAEVVDEEPSSSAGATAAGDPRRLRGLPAIGRGCASTITGTDPLRGFARERTATALVAIAHPSHTSSEFTADTARTTYGFKR